MSLRLPLLALSLSVAALLPGTAVAQENYSTWGYHKYVYFPTSMEQAPGAGVTGDIRNFPVLVRLSASNFNSGFAQSVGRGADLRFTKPGDVVPLPYQIERWDSAGKLAEIWVKLDTVAKGQITFFRMHWGKAGAADSSKSAAVFDTTAGFQAVWHMSEAAGDSARDVTGNRFKGVPAGTPGTIGGVVGAGRSFNGADQWFEVPNSAAGKLNFPINGTFTFSAWAYIDPVAPGTPQDNSVIIMKHDNQYALKLDLYGAWQFYEYDGTWSAVLAQYEESRWTYVTGVLDGRNTYLYVDGLEMANLLDCCNGGGSRNEGTNVFIGRRGDQNSRWWRGNLDEVRVSSVARSAEWIRLEYLNQRAGYGALLFDSLPVSVAPSGSPRATNPALIQATAGGLSFAISTGNSPKARFTVVDLRGNTVWSRTVEARDGKAQASWTSAPKPGLYAVRMSILDARGATVEAHVRKLTFTR